MRWIARFGSVLALGLASGGVLAGESMGPATEQQARAAIAQAQCGGAGTGGAGPLDRGGDSP